MTVLSSFPPNALPLPEGSLATRALLKYVPQMPLVERGQRWDQLRNKMPVEGVDALVLLGNDIYRGTVMATIRYLLQVVSQIDADALFPSEGLDRVFVY